MVEKTLRSAINAEHKIESIVESSTDGSADATEKEFQQIRRLAEQAALSAIKTTENWGKNALNKTKEHTEEITL